MAIEIAQPPAQSLQALSTVLPRLAGRVGTTRHAPLITRTLEMATQHPSALEVAPIAPVLSSPVFVLGLDAIANRSALTASRQAYWTHLLPSEGNEVVAADVNSDRNEFAALTQGPHPSAFLQEVRTLQASPAMQGHSYQLAQLRVPALHVTAVWLQDKEGKNDIIIPIAPTPPELIAGRSYSAGEFENALQERTKAILAETDPLKGG